MENKEFVKERNALFQGEIDVFCALYAVLNVLRRLYGLGLLESRDLFHETLVYEAQDIFNWCAILEQKTDYLKLVEAMLQRARKKYPLNIHQPFARQKNVSATKIWDCIVQNAQESKAPTSLLFMFIRHLDVEKKLEIRHWTSAHILDKNKLVLFDSSRNKGALKVIEKDKIVPSYEELQLGKVWLVPYSLYCIQKQ